MLRSPEGAWPRRIRRRGNGPLQFLSYKRGQVVTKRRISSPYFASHVVSKFEYFEGHVWKFCRYANEIHIFGQSDLKTFEWEDSRILGSSNFFPKFDGFEHPSIFWYSVLGVSDLEPRLFTHEVSCVFSPSSTMALEHLCI